MKTPALCAMFAGIWLISGTGPGAQPSTSDGVAGGVSAHLAIASVAQRAASSPIDPENLTAVVQQYCVVCHNDQLLTGNLSLNGFAVDHAAEKAQTTERMIRKLRAGMMPPPGIPRPGGDTLVQLVETLESVVDKAAAAAPNIGVRRFQRLSQAEYERVIHDLLSLDIDAGRWLPPDVLVGSFDNGSAGQRLNTTLLDSYLRAATEISRMAVGNPGAASTSMTYSAPMEISQHEWDHLEGAPFGTRGGIVITHDFPADGEYSFEVKTLFGGGTWIPEDLDISVDGEPVALLKLEVNGEHGLGGHVAPFIRTEPVSIPAGQHRVSAAFVRREEGPYEDRFIPPDWSSAAGRGDPGWADYGITGLTHVSEFIVTGPVKVTGVSETASRAKIFTCRPSSADQAKPCAERIIESLATQAYRRPVEPEALTGLMSFYDMGDGFEIGVRNALQAILSSPEFVFRLEREPEGVESAKGYRLAPIDLATRLSFFLWATSPDEELLRVAESGKLSDSRVLEQQVKRMLKDPRADALSTRFVHQWLRLQDVGKVWPEQYLYPDFSRQLAESMVKETQMLFQYLVREDRSLLELFSADYTFVNERLAKHYGIEGVVGEEMRRVQYPNDERRGVLGHGSVLNLTSMSDRTSPVLRGKWVMEVLMGTPPPPPPPNVPAFEASPQAAGGRRLTTRERMEAHAKSPVCNSCHRFIDPIGLALDNYDATGKWRIRENMEPLDTRGVFYDGTPITKPIELVQVLLKRPTPLVRNFTDHLLSYAIGRPAEYYDQPTIRAIAREAGQNDYRMSSFIMGVIKSPAFQMRQTLATAN